MRRALSFSSLGLFSGTIDCDELKSVRDDVAAMKDACITIRRALKV